MADYRVRRAQWNLDRTALRAVREAVFVVEQRVPIELEWDEHDEVSLHALAESPSGEPIGTGRLLPDGHIGRMAVLRPWRGQGVGAALLRHLIAAAGEAALQEVVLHAQIHALPFYAQQGFAAEGEPFMEAGIEHVRMRLRL